MKPIVLQCDQRTEAWRQARLGKLTGSRAADVVATIKTDEAAARRDYRAELVCERLTGLPAEEGYVSKEMQRGTDLEPMAFARYEAKTGRLVQRTGFLCEGDGLPAGCSLDGHIGDFEGIIELKCPKTATHLKYLRSSQAPYDYLPQITHNLWISGAAWCDFVSFDDRLPYELQIVIQRVVRDELSIAEYSRKAIAFLADVDRDVAELQALMRRVA